MKGLIFWEIYKGRTQFYHIRKEENMTNVKYLIYRSKSKFEMLKAQL